MTTTTTTTTRRKSTVGSATATTSSTTTTMLWQAVLCALLWSHSAVPVTANWSEDGGSRTQYIQGQFGVRLSPTPSETTLTSLAIDQHLRQALEDVVDDYLLQEFPDFTYVWLLSPLEVTWTGGATRRQLQDESSTTVIFQGATVAFDSAVTGADSDVWFQTAIENALVNKLDFAPFDSVTKVEYISFAPTPSPTPAPADSGNTIVSGAEVGDFELQAQERGNAGRTIGWACGVVLVIGGAALLVQKQRQQNAAAEEIMRDLELEVEDGNYDARGKPPATTVVEEDDYMTDTGDSEMAAYNESVSGRHSSRAGSRSVGGGSRVDSSVVSLSGASGVGDGVSVVSEYTVGDDASRASNPMNRASSGAIFTENFDRQTRIQKDMLQGEWSLQQPSSQPDHSAELVLAHSGPVGGGMSFEKYGNQGEEIYLMPNNNSSSRNQQDDSGSGGVAC